RPVVAPAGPPVGDADQGFEVGEPERSEVVAIAQNACLRGPRPSGLGPEVGSVQELRGKGLAAGQRDRRSLIAVEDAQDTGDCYSLVGFRLRFRFGTYR